jgi:capsular exopolysaccharide synthesis family protein
MNKIARRTAIQVKNDRTYNPDPPTIHIDPEASAVPVSHYAWILRREWWKIALFAGAVTLAALVVSSRITPIYEATATIDIDRQTPSGVVGQEANRSVNNDTEQFLATQIKLVQSDAVVRPVAQKYNLLELERQRTPGSNSTETEMEPVTLNRLKVTRPINTFLLQVSYQSPDRQLAADVANAVAQSYLAHSYNIRFRSASGLATFMEKQTEELRSKMERSSAALIKFERDLNVIGPEEKTNIVTARLLQLNTEMTTAHGDRVRKEASAQLVRSDSPQAVQASLLGEPLRELTERIHQTQTRFSEVRAQYGTAHPAYKKVEAQLTELQRLYEDTRKDIIERAKLGYEEALNRETILKNSVQEAKVEFDRLNAHSFEYQALKREADGDRALYEELLRKIREAGVNANFQNNSIRIANEARPAHDPIFPRVPVNVMLAFLFSTLFAVAAAIVRDAFDNTVRDPETMARALNTQVLGSLPLVKNWQGQVGPSKAESAGVPMIVGGVGGSVSNNYSEAIRTVRNSILLSQPDPRLRSLLITSASPGEGKSTLSSHLAATHAMQGQRTLLIDGDLRRPRIHRRFGIQATVGLSSVLLREKSWRQVLAHVDGLPDLDVLAAGPPLQRGADLIGRSLAEIIEDAVPEYDLVIVDGPPMLGFAEPLQMATIVDGVVVVAHAGHTDRKAVAAVLNTLTRMRAHVTGLVLNQVRHEMSQSYKYYKTYGKYYDASANAEA